MVIANANTAGNCRLQRVNGRVVSDGHKLNRGIIAISPRQSTLYSTPRKGRYILKISETIMLKSLKNAQRCNLKGCTVGKTTRSKKIIRDVIEVQNNEKTRDAKIQHT